MSLRSGRALGGSTDPTDPTGAVPASPNPNEGQLDPTPPEESERGSANAESTTPPATLEQRMMAVMEMMARSMAAREANQSTPAPVRAQEPKVKDPETFHGQRDGLNAFITECELVFELQPSRFLDDRTKVSYMISLLRGSPLLAVRPLMSAVPRPFILEDHRSFVDYLRTNYGDPDEKGTARRKLKALRQTSSASAYFAEFQQYIL